MILSQAVNPAETTAQPVNPVAAGAPPPAQSPAPAPVSAGPSDDVSPDEQALYTSIVSNAMKVMYGDSTSDKVIAIMKKSPEPAEGVAQAANMIGTRIYDAAKQQGKDIPGDVLSAAAEEVVPLLFELGEKAGALQGVTEDDEFKALTRTMQLWSESHPDMMDTEGMKQSFSQMDKKEMTDMLGQMANG